MPLDRAKFLQLAVGLGLSLTGCPSAQQSVKPAPAQTDPIEKDPALGDNENGTDEPPDYPPDPCGEGDCTNYQEPPEDDRNPVEPDPPAPQRHP